MRFDRLIISGDGSIWMIHDIEIGQRSQLQQDGSLPGDMFATSAIDSFLSFDVAEVNTVVAITLSNIGTEPAFFNAVLIGQRLDGGLSSRMVLPLSSNIAIDPAGHHIVIEIDEVIYRVSHQTTGVVMTPVADTALSARELEAIDVEYDRSELAADGRDVRTRVVMLHPLERTYVASLTRPPPEPFRPPGGLQDRKLYPFGLIIIDEYLGRPILAIGNLVDGRSTMEWHPEGYEPAWLATKEPA